MDEALMLTLSDVVLDSPDAAELAAFYRRLLGWAVEEDEPGWVRLHSPAAVVPDRAPLRAAGVARRAR